MSTFKNFESSDIVSGRIQSVSTGMFSDGNPVFSSVFYTSSNQAKTKGSSDFDVKSGLYYYDLYSEDPNLTTTNPEYILSVAYGSLEGTGSSDKDRDSLKIFPTKAVYNQYRNVLLTPDDSKFTFESSSNGASDPYDSSDIYVMSFASSKYKERLDSGNFEFSLSGSNGVFTFVDDSLKFINSTTGSITRKNVYNIVRGNLESGSVTASVGNAEGIGLVYPNMGIVVLNPSRLSEVVGSELLPSDGTSTDWALNHKKIFNSLNDAASNENKPFRARSTEFVPSRQYFIRVKNQEFNYSNNPTFVLDPTVTGNANDEGKLRFSDFSSNPKVYITTVGLYNEENELVAVAKLSQPFLKSFDTEAVVKVKLDF